jgi:hypothetical protein
MLQPIVDDALQAAVDAMTTSEPWSTFWSEQEARRLVAAALQGFLQRFPAGAPIYPHVVVQMLRRTVEQADAQG